MTLIDPKEITLKLPDGTEKVYILSKFPAVQGREIICKYPMSALPKLGDYGVSQETMVKLMSYIGVKLDGKDEPQMLKTIELINSHVPGPVALMRLEGQMLNYNVDFLQLVKSLGGLGGLSQMLHQLVTKTLTDLSGPSSAKAEQPSTN